MTEHYTLNTESVTAWCNKCCNLTQHIVSGGRRGRCMECGPVGESKKQKEKREKQEKEAREPKLF